MFLYEFIGTEYSCYRVEHSNNRHLMYLNAFENGDIPHEGFLSMNDLPSVVHWSEDKLKPNSLSIESIETCPSVIGTTSPVEENYYS